MKLELLIIKLNICILLMMNYANMMDIAKYKGKKMSLLDYRTHDYALAAHHFIKRLVMNMGPTISYDHGCE